MIVKNLTAGFSINCEIARSLWKKITGLSFSDRRRSMLFAFPRPGRWEFWMFGMRYPLLMIFLDDERVAIDVQCAKPMTLNPRTWKIHKPKKLCSYALELPLESGFHFGVGDRLEWC